MSVSCCRARASSERRCATQCLTISDLLESVLVTALRNLVGRVSRVEIRFRDNSLLYQSHRAFATKTGFLELRFGLSDCSSLLHADLIVSAIRRKTETRARLAQSRLRLLHAKFVVVWFELRNYLSLPDDTAEINRNCIESSRRP